MDDIIADIEAGIIDPLGLYAVAIPAPGFRPKERKVDGQGAGPSQALSLECSSPSQRNTGEKMGEQLAGS